MSGALQLSGVLLMALGILLLPEGTEYPVASTLCFAASFGAFLTAWVVF